MKQQFRRQNAWILVLSIIALVLIAGCTSTGSVTEKSAQDLPEQQTAASQPDKIVQELSYKGCPSLITEQELDAATSWKSIDTQYIIGNYGKINLECTYYESVGTFKYKVFYNLYVGGNEKFDNLVAAYKNRFPTKEYSEETILGIRSFSSKPNLLTFVDKQTGIVVWLQMDAGNLQLTDADWNNLVSIGRAIEAKLA